MIASRWFGSLMGIVINLPLIGIWVKFLQIPYRWLYSIHPDFLLHRRLYREQHHDRCADHGRIRALWTPPDQNQMRAGAVDLGLYLGTENFRRSLNISPGARRYSRNGRSALASLHSVSSSVSWSCCPPSGRAARRRSRKGEPPAISGEPQGQPAWPAH